MTPVLELQFALIDFKTFKSRSQSLYNGLLGYLVTLVSSCAVSHLQSLATLYVALNN